VTVRTLVRWQTEGKFFQPWQDPNDRLRRRMYDAERVHAFKRKLARKSGQFRIDLPTRQPPEEPWLLEPTLPGPVAGRVYARLQNGDAIDDICKDEGVAPEQVIRLERLREQFEQERKRPTKRSTAPPRAISDESHPDIAAIAKDLDEERARRASEVLAEKSDEPPPRSRRSG
jgi:hypothetical protein